MRCSLKIECDKCIDDIEIELQGKGLKDVLTLNVIRDELKNAGWHTGKLCLCPDCKSEIGEENCLNCKSMHYNDFNYRCEKDASIVSEYDNCPLYKKRCDK